MARNRLYFDGSCTSFEEEHHYPLCTLVAWGCWAKCIGVHILEPPPPSSKKKRSGAASGSEQPKDPPLFRKPLSSQGWRRRGKAKRVRAKKGMKTPPTESAATADYFADIDLGVEDRQLKGLP